MDVFSRARSYRQAAAELGCSFQTIVKRKRNFQEWMGEPAAFDYWLAYHNAKLDDELETLRMERRVLSKLTGR